ncbi:MAG: hypothetical protein SO176_03920 [Bacilli bacterium]|nr:hypothetical protein [Bacilli bacterium]
MGKSKKQILSELYCIKAGLSAISMEKDKVTEEENKLIKLSKEITQKNNNISKLKTSIANEEWEVTFYQNNSYESIKKPKIYHQIKSAFLGAFGGALISPIAVIVVSFLIGLVAAALDKDTSASFAFMHHPIIFLYALIGCATVGLFIGIGGSYFKELKSYKADEERRQKAISANNQKISEHKTILKGYENELTSCNYALEKNANSYKDNYAVYENVKKLTIPTSEQLYSALVNQFNSTLDCRDWKHIDLIIFYYETGRADTLKECLQQVDRQVQTDAIIKEIRSASKNISNTIKTSIMGLQQEMVVCFDKLSVQLDRQHKETMSKLTSIDKSIAKLNDGVETLNNSIKDGNAIMSELSDNMNKISEATYLQNALLEKISVDSMTLVRDTHYMIDYKTPDTIVSFKMPETINYKETTSRTGIESKTN